jgi:hypothetical protein
MSPRPPPRAKPERCELCHQRATLGYSDAYDVWVCVGRLSCEMRQRKQLEDQLAEDEADRRMERDE